ncbi:MAG: hypothetical protein SGPRY_009870, partial [Prymnesium sp.]
MRSPPPPEAAEPPRGRGSLFARGAFQREESDLTGDEVTSGAGITLRVASEETRKLSAYLPGGLGRSGRDVLGRPARSSWSATSSRAFYASLPTNWTDAARHARPLLSTYKTSFRAKKAPVVGAAAEAETSLKGRAEKSKEKPPPGSYEVVEAASHAGGERQLAVQVDLLQGVTALELLRREHLRCSSFKGLTSTRRDKNATGNLTASCCISWVKTASEQQRIYHLELRASPPLRLERQSLPGEELLMHNVVKQTLSENEREALRARELVRKARQRLEQQKDTKHQALQQAYKAEKDARAAHSQKLKLSVLTGVVFGGGQNPWWFNCSAAVRAAEGEDAVLGVSLGQTSNLLSIPQTMPNSGLRSTTCRHLPRKIIAFSLQQAHRSRTGELLSYVRAIASEVCRRPDSRDGALGLRAREEARRTGSPQGSLLGLIRTKMSCLLIAPAAKTSRAPRRRFTG